MTSNEIYPGVTVDQAVMAGTLVIAGTRVPVRVVLDHLAAGDIAEDIQAHYDLTQENIRATLGYAASIVDAERVYVVS
ncbi:MAG TPA: DUF433 domain-containing protein [Ktedonobacterales bacterium]|nr:DUF433 domain-containing protein [Ktedonobacterales bacterium]